MDSICLFFLFSFKNSSDTDVQKFLKFIESSFVPQLTHLDLFGEKPFHPATEGYCKKLSIYRWHISLPLLLTNFFTSAPFVIAGFERITTRCFLKSITIYPIKSCAGFSVEIWPLSNTGIMYKLLIV